jgi:hypothetical protein
MTCLILDLWIIIHNYDACTGVYNRRVCTLDVMVHEEVTLLEVYDQ